MKQRGQVAQRLVRLLQVLQHIRANDAIERSRGKIEISLLNVCQHGGVQPLPRNLIGLVHDLDARRELQPPLALEGARDLARATANVQQAARPAGHERKQLPPHVPVIGVVFDLMLDDRLAHDAHVLPHPLDKRPHPVRVRVPLQDLALTGRRDALPRFLII